MADEYTPTTEQVRAGYSEDPVGEYHDPVNAPSNQRAIGRAFDRWLAAHDAEIAAAARTEAIETMRAQAAEGADEAWVAYMAEHGWLTAGVSAQTGMDFYAGWQARALALPATETEVQS